MSWFRITHTAKSKQWRFPLDRFVSYDEEDKWWAIPLRFGRWIDTVQTIEIPEMVIGQFDSGGVIFQALSDSDVKCREISR